MFILYQSSACDYKSFVWVPQLIQSSFVLWKLPDVNKINSSFELINGRWLVFRNKSGLSIEDHFRTSISITLIRSGLLLLHYMYMNVQLVGLLIGTVIQMFHKIRFFFFLIRFLMISNILKSQKKNRHSTWRNVVSLTRFGFCYHVKEWINPKSCIVIPWH